MDVLRVSPVVRGEVILSYIEYLSRNVKRTEIKDQSAGDSV